MMYMCCEGWQKILVLISILILHFSLSAIWYLFTSWPMQYSINYCNKRCEEALQKSAALVHFLSFLPQLKRGWRRTYTCTCTSNNAMVCRGYHTQSATRESTPSSLLHYGLNNSYKLSTPITSLRLPDFHFANWMQIYMDHHKCW